MQVRRITSLDEVADRATTWDRMADGVPFLGWAWMSSWWRTYGRRETSDNSNVSLFTLLVEDSDGTLLGVAPWYLEETSLHGRVVRFLGSGEVASDYLSLLCQPSREDAVAEAVAHWLSSCDDGDDGKWDLLDLSGIDAEDVPIARLVEHLRTRSHSVHLRDGMNCWRLNLPSKWEDYLALLSKSHRQRLRRAERKYYDTGRVVLHSVQQMSELPKAMEMFVQLHQKRRLSLGEPGCFSSARFEAFHREVVQRLLHAGQLGLQWIELDGQPIATEYILLGGGIHYFYQSGLDPDMLDNAPGQLISQAIIRRAIEQGDRAFDFLRGNEPYKAHWRAKPKRSLRLRVAPPRAVAQLRNGVWLAGNRAKQCIRGGMQILGLRDK